MSFGEKLQSLRKGKGYSQEGLAELLGVSRQAISKWESDQFYPDMQNLIALSDIFKVSIDSLLKDGTVSPPEAQQQVRLHLLLTPEYEYKSKRMLFGLPLLHVNIGRGKRVAKGIVAVGNLSVGVVSCGLLSVGLLSAGLLGAGLISLSVLALGIFSLGAVALGIFSAGAIAIGVVATGAVAVGKYALGACSVATDIAVGDYARGRVAVGRNAHGLKTLIDAGPGQSFPSGALRAAQVRRLIAEVYPRLWQPVVDFLTWPFV